MAQGLTILYFDPHSLFYSQRYLDNNPDVGAAFDLLGPISSTDTRLKNVCPDRAGLNRFSQAALDAGVLLYPTGNQYSRELLLKHQIIEDSLLAPFVDVRARLRPDDNDPVRLMLAHASALSAQWYVCGDIASDTRLEAYPGRTLLSDYSGGINDDLLSQIRAMTI